MGSSSFTQLISVKLNVHKILKLFRNFHTRRITITRAKARLHLRLGNVQLTRFPFARAESNSNVISRFT